LYPKLLTEIVFGLYTSDIVNKYKLGWNVCVEIKSFLVLAAIYFKHWHLNFKNLDYKFRSF
jgi:hypothetical protein